jgi:hypothetical protein
MSVRIKPTVNNIINLWFSVDTPIRQYKIKLNPEIWGACQTINQTFYPPSKRPSVERYRKMDKVAFAKAVQEQLARSSTSRSN